MSMGLFSIYSKLGKIIVKRHGSSEPVDKSNLEELISLIDDEIGEEASYTPSTWSVYSSARATADAVMLNSSATQLDVNSAESALETAYGDLITRADRNELINLLTTIENNVKPEEDYTPETWTPFAVAHSEAISLRDDPEATQQEVDDIVDVLNNAYLALEEVDPA